MCNICRQSVCPSGCPNAPEPPTIATCKYCGENIVAGDGYYEYYGDCYHEDCFSDVAIELLTETGAVWKEASIEDIDDGSDDAYEEYRDEQLFG